METILWIVVYVCVAILFSWMAKRIERRFVFIGFHSEDEMIFRKEVSRREKIFIKIFLGGLEEALHGYEIKKIYTLKCTTLDDRGNLVDYAIYGLVWPIRMICSIIELALLILMALVINPLKRVCSIVFD